MTSHRTAAGVRTTVNLAFRAAAVCLLAVATCSCGETPGRQPFDPGRDLRRSILPKGPRSDFFAPQQIGESIRGTERPQIAQVEIVDLDKDGLPDILVCDAGRNRLSWIRQLPKGVYTEQLITADI